MNVSLKLYEPPALKEAPPSTRRPRVYIAGPITLGDRKANYQKGVVAHGMLMRTGFAVLNPILTMQLPFAFSAPHQDWIDSCLPWVDVAEAIYRLPGESKGADIECNHAKDNGTPVFFNLPELKRYFFGDA